MWRFKTKEEFIQSGSWTFSVHNAVGGYPKGWSSDGSMNCLLGQPIPEIHNDKCRGKRTFTMNNKVINKDDYVEITGETFPAITQEGTVFFNMDRLVEEINLKFQGILENNKLIAEAQCTDALSVVIDGIQTVKEKVHDIIIGSKDELLLELQKGRAVINLPNRPSIEIKHDDHPEMENVVKSLILHHKAMLVGPAGTGKTYMVAQIADRMNLSFYKYSCSRDSSVHDLIGYKQPKSETYLETVFLNAYENGGIFLVDEYDAMSGDMSLFFNGVADNSKFISIPHRDNKPIARKHKDFYLIMCGNTWGTGSIEYSGRDFQDMALMDRFRLCRHYIGYHSTLEKAFMQDNYSFTISLRTALESIGSYLSTRNVEDISNLLRSGVSKKEVLDTITMDLDNGSKQSVFSKVKVV